MSRKRKAWLGLVRPRKAEMPMCEKCEELDKKIDHYRTLMARVTDRQTNEGIAKLIENLRAQKAALHPEREAH
jgi:hypothetical protein